jgi:predicted DNA-binding transcriptional regulator AlpA
VHEKVLNTAEAAIRTGLSVATLEKKRVYGTGPMFLKLGRAVRYRESDLAEWLYARLQASTSESVSS